MAKEVIEGTLGGDFDHSDRPYRSPSAAVCVRHPEAETCFTARYSKIEPLRFDPATESGIEVKPDYECEKIKKINETRKQRDHPVDICRRGG